MNKKKLKVVLCWHMHQPHYRDGLDGEYQLPWVYLHAMKDYTDMIWHLEQCPQAKVVVNFAPVLLEQIENYALQIQQFIAKQTPTSDPLLNLLAGAEPIPAEPEARKTLVMHCQRAFAPTMIDTLPAFKKLLDLVENEALEEVKLTGEPAGIQYFNEQFFIDLLMWYHLAWMGQSVRQQDSRVRVLMDKGADFDASDQLMMMAIIADTMANIIPRYKARMQAGQIEISMTPYGHPIVPLLIDFASMRDAQPCDPAPEYSGYPDGYERAKWHLNKGMQVHERFFGEKPQGVWLSEGAVSNTSLGLLDEFEVKWTASGESVWRHSCDASRMDPHLIHSKRALFRPLEVGRKQTKLFCRDDGLSDLIGFQYKDWNPLDAAKNFVHNLENIHTFLGDEVEDHVISVILDGENAWEYYPNNAADFLTALYRELTENKRIITTTFTEALQTGAKPLHLSDLKAGSWVYGSFSTWIGDKDKNRAWDLLIEAKQTYDEVLLADTLTAEEQANALAQLAICEGSDWFWWFGDYNPSDSVRDFDRLYRRHLTKLYQLLKQPAPDNLANPISFGGGDMANAGTMRRN